MSNRTWIAIGVVALLGVCSACACVAVTAGIGLRQFSANTQVSEKTLTELRVDAPATVNVINPVGDVTVGTGPDDRLTIEAEKKAQSFSSSEARNLLNQIRVRVRNEGRVRIEVELPESPRVGSTSVDLIITMPGRVELDIVNQVGDVRVAGVTGNVRVRSDVGDVQLQDVVVVNECNVISDVGAIRFRGRLPERQGEVLLRTGVGDVTAMVPAGSRFALDAETNVGDVQSGFELRDRQSGRVNEVTGRWLKGGVNTDANGVRLVLRAETGDIAVEPLR